ncbi:hypothetical protein BKA82DRAFT_26095 [Pisolithus tinctorius]|uniref:Uncharacterized protein n=1 Tax=Pisolithus tinctorius Marx 270 TaxID=870435 RepID=A0A0C3PAL3_PISTI|nr:hypothetical protein BKA82DRAFT_26095 [Pisolithus tinctorius]KIO04644.1 hypothetical protein M404DRAFT_26095 [Pisolithus tinctorius Marx 270]
MQKLHVTSSIGIISCKVPHTNNSDLTHVRLNNAMKTYTKHDELTTAVNSIIKIINWKVLGMKDLADKPRFAAWKEAVRRVVEVVDSVREIARITHEIPLTIIVAERFCKWHERVGWENEGHPFPKWRLIMHPDKATFDDHPWLQTVERHFDLQHTSFKTSAFPPTAEPSSETLLKAASHKGKEKVSDAEVKVMIGDDDGKDELADEDAEMGGDTIRYEPARGRPLMRQVAASGSHQPARQSWTPKPKLVKQEEVDELDEEDDDEEDMDINRPGTSGHPTPQSTGQEVMSHHKSSEKKVHTMVRQIADEYAALSLCQAVSDQRLDSVIWAIEALWLEVVALAAGRLPPPDDPTSGLVTPPPPSDDGNDAMAGLGHPGDAKMSGMEGDPAVESMEMQEGQFDQGHPGNGEL